MVTLSARAQLGQDLARNRLLRLHKAAASICAARLETAASRTLHDLGHGFRDRHPQPLPPVHQVLADLHVADETAAFLLNEVPLPLHVIGFVLGRSEKWVSASILRTDALMRRSPSFQREVAQLQARLAGLLSGVIAEYPTLR